MLMVTIQDGQVGVRHVVSDSCHSLGRNKCTSTNLKIIRYQSLGSKSVCIKVAPFIIFFFLASKLFVYIFVKKNN